MEQNPNKQTQRRKPQEKVVSILEKKVQVSERYNQLVIQAYKLVIRDVLIPALKTATFYVSGNMVNRSRFPLLTYKVKAWAFLFGFWV